MIKMFSKRTKNQKGFTLVELIVVVAIIGILAAVAVPRFSNVTDNAKNKAALAEHRMAVSAVQMAVAEREGVLPTEASHVDPFIQNGVVNGLEYTVITYGDSAVVVTTTSTASEPEETETTIN